MILGMIVGAFVLVALAVARFTLMVTSDRIMLAFRRWAVNKFGDESIWTYFVHCGRCVSVWVALPGAILWGTLTLPLHWWWLIAPAWFALSYLTVLLSRLEEKD
jgi:sterol desaturase/sphingolipid hydroxylase (fatty acid hydroxylase superfamily)